MKVLLIFAPFFLVFLRFPSFVDGKPKDDKRKCNTKDLATTTHQPSMLDPKTCDTSPSEQFYFGEGNRVIHYNSVKAAQPSVVFEDFTHAGYYAPYRPPTVNCTCTDPTLSKHYYKEVLMIQYQGESEPHPDPTTAINVTCGGGNWPSLCACTESGTCYHAQNQVDWPVYLRLYPFCELGNKEECHVYAEVEGSAVISETNQSDVFAANSANGPLGVNSAYLKVASVSCNHCDKIRSTNCFN